MTPKRVSINGCGRIGRLALRLAWARPDAFTIVHLNDVAAIESVAYLIQFDSVHGTWGVKVSADGTSGTITLSEGERTLAVPYSCSRKLEELKDIKASAYEHLRPEMHCRCQMGSDWIGTSPERPPTRCAENGRVQLEVRTILTLRMCMLIVQLPTAN